MPERPLQHREPDKKDDETLRKEARAHLAAEPALQLVAELIAKLREVDLPWWTPARLRERWGAVERMRWFRERADLRQRITTSLTGLAPKAARRKTADFQGSLIDSVIDDGDITVRTFEEAFQPFELAVYGPAGGYWNFFREAMPWDQDKPIHHELMAWLLKALLADRSPFDGIGRTPILTPWDVRTAIDGRVWHTRMPLEIRVAIDEARLQQERDRPGVPFHAEGDLAIAVPEIIAASLPLRDLIPVMNVAQKSMRFEAPRGAAKIDAGAAGAGLRASEIVSPSAPPQPLTGPPPPLSSGPPTLAGGPPTAISSSPSPSAPPQGPAHIAFDAGPGLKAPAGPGPGPAPFDPGAGPKASAASGPAPGSFDPGAKAGPAPPPMVTPGSVPPPPLVPAGAPAPGMTPGGAGGPPPGLAQPPASGGSPATPKVGQEGIAPPPMIDPGRVSPDAGGARGPGARGAPPGGGATGLLAVLNSFDPEDEMEMTNPYHSPTPEEIAAESARLPPDAVPVVPVGKRRPKA